MAWDRSSNVTLIEDEVFHSGIGADMDTEFTMDDLDRLTRAQWGTYSGGIGSEWRDQNWVLDQAGNWEDVNLDVDADGAFTSAGEYDDDRVHEQANNLTDRDVDDDGTNDFDLVYNQRGDLTDDDEHFEYVYDVWGRLKTVKNQSSTIVAVYNYNGLNHLIARHEDTDDDGDADQHDTTFRHLYDDQWRIVATFREDDDDPKEQFVYHHAGADGRGGSSYIDAVVLRDKDADTSWTSASDGTLEHRLYYIQNWRADVVALVDANHELREWVRYDPYGTPYGMPQSDTNGDGTVDSTDNDNINNNWWGTGAHPTGDHDLDHDIDVEDLLAQLGNDGDTLGWGALSLDEGSANNRKGYAGYEHLSSLAGGYTMWHVRHRVLNSELGRWIRRDPLGYVDSAQLYNYSVNNPLAFSDPYGQSIVIDSECNRFFEGCWTDPFFQWALDYEEEHCFGVQYRVTCNPDPDAAGSIVCEDFTQIINVDPIDSRNDCATLAHELIHAGDMCAMGQCGFNGPVNRGPVDCDEWMCSELRAIHIGCCTNADPYASYEDCFLAGFNHYWAHPLCGDAVDWNQLWADCLGWPTGYIPLCDATMPIHPFPYGANGLEDNVINATPTLTTEVRPCSICHDSI